jgi:Protein of unknown function (DUF1569)
MAATLWNEPDRRNLVARIERLAPDRAPKWGRMDASRMVVHLTDALYMATGDIQCAAKNTPLAWPGVKQLIMFYLPWPKGSPTAPELLARSPMQWADEVGALRQALEHFARQPVNGDWPAHPAFGRLNAQQWGRLAHRHIDHHLTQFGV